MNQKKQYIAPELTVVSFKMEKGYATSGLLPEPEAPFILGLFGDADGYNSQGQQVWEEDNSTFGTVW